MTDRQIERAAYIAAHRILEADMSAPNLVCDGAIRTHAVDTIAHIICEAIDFEEAVVATGRPEALVPGACVPGFRSFRTPVRSATILEMPARRSI